MLLCRQDVHDYQLRAVENTGHLCALPGQAPADEKCRAVKIIPASGILRKHPLVGGVQAVHKAWDTPLATVGMAGDDQVKRIFQIAFDLLRPVGQKNGKGISIQYGLSGALSILRI